MPFVESMLSSATEVALVMEQNSRPVLVKQEQTPQREALRGGF